jgi:uncharacterized membrane protein (DUF485 family)
MSIKKDMDEFRRGVDWASIYNSELFKTIKRNRMKFVISGLIGVIILFSFLWTTQSYLPDLAHLRVIGYVNFAFLFTMILFPTIWIAGFAYTRYVGKHVEPYENELNELYGHKEDDAS